MSARLRFPVIPTMPPGLVVVILSLLLGLQPITTDLYLPALPGLTADFGAYTAQAQLTLTALLLAFGLSQLIWGPLSDQFSWRAALFALAIFSALPLAMVALRFEKTVTLTCRRLLPRFGVKRSVAIAGGLSLTGGSLGAKWRADKLGHHAALLPLHAGARHQPALQSKRCSGSASAGSWRCIGAQRLFDDDGRFCHGRLAGTPHGRHFVSADRRRLVLECPGCAGGLDAGSKTWQNR